MLTPLKKTLLITSGALFLGGPVVYGLYKLSSDVSHTEIGTPLSLNSEFKKEYEEGTFGRKFGNYFKDASGNSDSLFWKNKLSPGGKPRSGFGNFFKNINSPEQLKNKCSEFYKKKTEESSNKDANGTFLLDKIDVWSFCSEFDNKPSIISSPGEASSTSCSGKFKCEKDSYLIEISSNAKFWEIRDKEFKEKDGYKLNIENKDSYKWFESQRTKTPETTIKELCKKAYEMNTSSSSTESTPSKEEVRIYCSIKEYFD